MREKGGERERERRDREREGMRARGDRGAWTWNVMNTWVGYRKIIADYKN